ncbi:hypothetical protein [Gottschalkia purinilytica]|uniref:hypothetical protein n=1 Tax=Gottschalkia purinilytica TaxID=1503 RepID=UPI0012FEB0F6|nr:hypothetical protein [Gottschalkia purinilytica]
MMYYYWTRKGVRPSLFYNMREEEKIVIRAFYELEIEEIQERTKNGFVCPQVL